MDVGLVAVDLDVCDEVLYCLSSNKRQRYSVVQ